MTAARKDDACAIAVRVVPRASRSEIVGMVDGVLKVRIAAPPVDGAANAELVRVLAKALQVSRSSIEIVAGETSKMKRVRISGVTDRDLARVLRAKS